ncbi:MAG: RNA methyltransferase [Spirochaetes bacterium]|nr:RNA methyltransferase [Spirochaetota bacterium]
MSDFNRFTVVLCGAGESGNIGSVCRAMKTMGFSRLSLAACGPIDEERVRMLSVHAFDLYERSARFDTLAAALGDADLVAGFTRRRGRRRKDDSSPVDRFATDAWARPPGNIALVFGNERSGLSRDELEACDVAVHIPTSDDFPSLNLSHAVQLACWELARTAPGAARPGSTTLAPRSEIDAAVSRITGRMASVGCFKIAGRPEAEVLLRSIIARAATSRPELERLEALAFRALARAVPSRPA